MDAFQFGAPPRRSLAGLDRLVAILGGQETKGLYCISKNTQRML
jgi:aspartyl-tRNA synthetase